MELELEHKTLIAEESINEKELPKEIRSAIRGLDLMIGKYKKNPTEENKDKIEAKSIVIADDIQTWNERDLTEEAEEEEQPIIETEEQKATREEAQRLAAEEEGKAKTTESAEAQIIAILKEKGKVDSRVLRDILEADSINDVPDKLKVGNTILERSLSYYYKVD